MMPDVSAADVEMLTRMVYFSSEARMARATPAELRRVRAVASLLRSDSCIQSLSDIVTTSGRGQYSHTIQ